MGRTILFIFFILCQTIILSAKNTMNDETFKSSSSETFFESEIPDVPFLSPLAECLNTSFSTVTLTNSTCNGSNNGSITVSITHTPLNSLFSLSVDNGVTWTSGNDVICISNLHPGTYNLVITDKNGICREYYSGNPVTLSEPPLLSIDLLTTTHVTTAGDLGTITITASGGTAPYEYSLDNVNWQSSNIFNSLNTGIYTLYVKDVNNCSDSQTDTVDYVVYVPDVHFKNYLV